jgi:Domain of unknown function (DUF6438)
VFYEGDFVEFNPIVIKHRIERIAFTTSYCFGNCPRFDLSIDQKRYGKLYAGTDNIDKKNNQKMEGDYAAIIKDTDYNKIICLLNYINFETLKDKYAVNWTDDQSCTLTITYDGGKVKKIEDYGLIGTFGLDRVYQVLFDLRFNQDWHRKKKD